MRSAPNLITRVGTLRAACLVSLVAACAFLTDVQAVGVPVVNAGFESDVLADGTGTNNSVSSWTSTIGSSCFAQCFGVFNPNVVNPGFPSGTVPEGSNALYMVSGSVNAPVSQVLTGQVMTAGTIYTLTVAVGNPADRADTATFGFELGVVGSGSSYASFNASLTTLTNGTFTDRTANSAILAGNPDIGKTLVIRLFGPTSQGPGLPYVAFDNVRLLASPVPEPAAAALWVMGMGALCMAIRRRRAPSDAA